MRPTAPHGLPLIVASTIALAAAMSSPAQTARTVAPPAAAPTSPESPARLKQPEELEWTAVGAAAQCNDGTFFHGTFDHEACADHGGVRRVLPGGHGQDLLR